MPTAVWTGSLAFGLVTIPVRLYPATEPKDVRFHLVDEQGRRVRYRRFVDESAADDAAWRGSASKEGVDTFEGAEAGEHGAGEVEAEAEDDDERDVRSTSTQGGEIAYEDLRRGYETGAGTVILEREEIEAVRPERSRVIEIEDFVRLEEIDPVFFEKSYVLAPQAAGEKPYALLQRAMDETDRAGIGRFVLRTKPHLVAVRPRSGLLALETLFFGDEVRDVASLARPVDDDMPDRELKLAETLIAALERDWDPSRYADTYREELLRRIAEKAPTAVEAFEPEIAAAEHGGVDALMEALKASVEQAKRERKPSKGRRKRSA
jgi:DNA end-binding protein Ku